MEFIKEIIGLPLDQQLRFLQVARIFGEVKDDAACNAYISNLKIEIEASQKATIHREDGDRIISVRGGVKNLCEEIRKQLPYVVRTYKNVEPNEMSVWDFADKHEISKDDFISCTGLESMGSFSYNNVEYICFRRLDDAILAKLNFYRAEIIGYEDAA